MTNNPGPQIVDNAGHHLSPPEPAARPDGVTMKSLLPYIVALIAFCGLLIPASNMLIANAVNYGMVLNRVATVEQQLKDGMLSVVPRQEHNQVWQQQDRRLAAIEASVHRIENKLGAGRL